MRILDAESVRAALPMLEAIAAVRWAFVAASSGKAVLPPRIHLAIPGSDAITLVMPGYVEASPDGRFSASLVVKTVSVYPGNPGKGKPAILGGVTVLDPDNGACIGLVDAATLTAIRTGAGSAVATDALARPESQTLAIFGAGAQAETQVEGVCQVRSIQEIIIVNRTPERAERLREVLRSKAITAQISIARTADEALARADIICTSTGSATPLFESSKLRPGTHVNAIGAFRTDMQEIPSLAVVRARVFVDSIESALHEAGDLTIPISQKLIGSDHIAGEIGSLLAGDIAGRESANQITLFKSVGLAAQDAVCASLAIQRASDAGYGLKVE